MLDRYWYGEASRISPEAPVPVVVVNDRKVSAGGAANVALNIAALACQVSVLGYVGEDAEATQLEDLLQQSGIQSHLISQNAFPTVQKLRVLGQNRQLIRMDFEKHFAAIDPAALLQHFESLVKDHDVVVLSDYNKGTLQCMKQLIALANQYRKPVLIDPKNIELDHYRGATLLTPNRKEFESLVGRCDSHKIIEEKAQTLMHDYSIQSMVVTLGAEGMLICNKDEPAQHLAASAQDVYDVTGAGDTVIAVLAATMAAAMPLYSAAKLANHAAAIVIKKLGSATISIAELHCELNKHRVLGQGVLTEEALLSLVAELRLCGKKIVMTNGCFDLLHAGHVEYLQAARAQGDCLLVAVNDDASVAALKGKGRPINPLSDRMQVVAALQSVDWVAPFSEATPARLIEAVLPDVLVKGSDYEVHQIAGSECVLKNGGEVKTIALKQGRSSTHIMNKIREVECV